MKPVPHIVFVIVSVFVSVFVSCTPAPKPVPADDVFTLGQVTRYGAHYQDEGIPSNVYMLDVYSDGLTLNEQNKIEGTGKNLCFSDVFTLPTDTRLQYDVTYQADTTGNADTFLPGQDFDGNINGAYLLDIRDGKVLSITLFQSGTFRMTQSADTTHIVFELVTTTKSVYKATFHAPLTYIRPL